MHKGNLTSRTFPFARTGALTAAFLLAAVALSAADWPAWRHDASRTGHTEDALPSDLSLIWTRAPRHAPRPAWPGEDTRMDFDRGCALVVAGGKLFFGSSADGKVHALDAATGREEWSFITEGPVRLPCTFEAGRIYVVSDDGFLYALGADDGTLIWKFRGGPSDERVLGNDCMISRWPARGGPVVSGGTVLFAAGIWPSEGIFIHALEAKTGKSLWMNSTSGSLELPQPHGGAVARSGVSAQGPLVLAGETLLVPTGRAVPAAFRRDNGTFLYFHLQRYGQRGGGGVISAGPCFFSGGGLFDTQSGHLLHQASRESTMAITPRFVLHADGREVRAFPRESLLQEEETFDRSGKKTVRKVLAAPRWRATLDHPPDVLISAGRSLVMAASGKLTILDRASGQVPFTTDLEGTVVDLAVADSRLFVSTARGEILCFGETLASGEPAMLEPEASVEPLAAGSPFRAAAAEIVRRSGITAGYCVDLQCGEGELAASLAALTDLRIHAVDDDPEAVRRARERLDRAGLLGVRVSVHLADPEATGFPDWCANLVVSAESVLEGPDTVAVDEARRLQRPWGGVLCVGKPGEMQASTRGALEGAGQWTHQYADAANTGCSDDTLVEGPLGMLWFTDFDFEMPNRHGRGPAPLFHEGRLLVEGLNALLCVDAYTGRRLWSFPLPRILEAYDQDHLMGAAGTGSNFCVGEEGLFVKQDSRCLRIDPATGRLLAEHRTPSGEDGDPGTWGALALEGRSLLGTLADRRHVVRWRYQRGDMSTQFTESLLLFVMDARTGEVRWRFRPKQSIRNNTIAIGEARVHLIDRPPAEEDLLEKSASRRGREDVGQESPPARLVTLDLSSGRTLWESSRDIFGTLSILSTEHDVLLMGYQDTRFKLDSETGGRLAAFRASTGERLWDVKADYGSRPVVNDRTIYAQPGAWDLLSGERLPFEFSRSYGCGILSSSRHLMVFRSATLGYRDLLNGQRTENYGGIRPGCWINAIPAGGLVLMPDATDHCVCSYLIKASIALKPRAGQTSRDR